MSNPTSPSTPPPASKAITPQPAPQTTLTDAEISARSTKHAAWLAAGAAILAAILALGGTLWNAHASGQASDNAAQTAADAAVKAVSVQLSGETEKSRAEFLRGQRQVLYSKIITDETLLFDQELKTYRLIKPDEAVEGRQYAKVKAELEKNTPLKSTLENDMSAAEIIASSEVRKNVDALWRIHIQIYVSLRERIDAPPTEQNSGAEIVSSLEQRSDSIKVLYRSARKDMGAE